MPKKATDPAEEAKKQLDKELAKKLADEHRKEQDADWAAFVAPLVNSGGRPTLYEPKFCDAVIRYFVTKPPYRVVSTMFGPKLVPNDLPTLAGFAVSVGVCKKTINNWWTEWPRILARLFMASSSGPRVGFTQAKGCKRHALPLSRQRPARRARRQRPVR